MRKLVLALSTAFALALSLSAQTGTQTAQANTVVRIDGGQSGRMESVFFPPKAGAPFSLTLATEWSRPLGNGGSYTLANQRRVMRDQAGRIYQERWILVPKGGKIQSHMDIFQIMDPQKHTWHNCIVATKTCDVYRYRLTTKAEYPPALLPAGALRSGDGFRQADDLGISSLFGIETHGYRETTTINAGTMGNDRPMVTVREFWYSPELAFNLISIVETPETGKQVFTAKDLSTSEPDPSFFEVPQDYTVVDRTTEK